MSTKFKEKHFIELSAIICEFRSVDIVILRFGISVLSVAGLRIYIFMQICFYLLNPHFVTYSNYT